MVANIDIMKLINPELLVLIPVNWGIGLAIRATKLSNQFIPICNALVSILLATLYAFSVDMGANAGMQLFSGITQGIICWLFAWFTYNKFIKENTKLTAKGTTSDTVICEEEIEEVNECNHDVKG